MNAALRATIIKVPERTIKAVTGGIALGSSSVSLFQAWLPPSSLGTGITYAILPLVVAVIAWLLLAIARLAIVGILPSDVQDDVVIPLPLQPWIRWWLLVRFGLLFGGVLVILIGAVGTMARLDFLGVAIHAFVDVVLVRVFLDAVFGAVFNAGVIHQVRQ